MVLRFHFIFSVLLGLLPLTAPLSLSFAGVSDPAKAEVDLVLARYRKAKAIRAKVKKKVVQQIMGTESESRGEFFFSKGKLRLDINHPESSVLVYDGKNIWMESRLDESSIEVTKIPSSNLRKADSLLAALFERKDVLKNFKTLENKKADDLKIYSFEPIDTRTTEVRFLEIAISGKEIERITYKDSRENLVSFEFADLTRGSVPSSKFSYSPPKNASVTVMK
ncbi:MAG: outer membrane lipoprotein carrier protein LolA [Bdellovibrionales bacterium]